MSSKAASSTPSEPLDSSERASLKPSTSVRVASDAAHQMVDQEMDAAFKRNVQKNREIQERQKAAR